MYSLHIKIHCSSSNEFIPNHGELIYQNYADQQLNEHNCIFNDIECALSHSTDDYFISSLHVM